MQPPDSSPDLSFDLTQFFVGEEPEDRSPSRRRLLAIYRTIRERIALLQYAPGTRLDIDELTTEFGVSRTPVRRALLRLEHEGLVVTRHGVGTMVTSVDFGSLQSNLLYRMHLAELLGQLSPLPPSPETVRTMEAALEQCTRLRETVDPEAFGRIDLIVHDCVCTLFGHAQLRATYDELFYRNSRMWRSLLPHLDWRGEVDRFRSDIELMVMAMRRGDSGDVGMVVRNSLSSALIRLRNFLDTVPGAPPTVSDPVGT